MATYNSVIKKRNSANNGWDTILPITTADNVLMGEGGETVNSQLADIAYHAEMFGVTFDGVTDTTLQMQSAVNFIGTNGGKLLFPKNKSFVMGSVKVPSNVTIDGNNSKMIGIAEKGFYNEYGTNIQIENMRFDSDIDCTFIHLLGTSGCRFNRFRFGVMNGVRKQGTAILLYSGTDGGGCYTNHIEDVKIYSIKNGIKMLSDYVVACVNANDISNVFVKNCEKAMWLEGAGYNTFSNIVLETNSTALYMRKNAAGAVSRYNKFWSLYVEADNTTKYDLDANAEAMRGNWFVVTEDGGSLPDISKIPGGLVNNGEALFMAHSILRKLGIENVYGATPFDMRVSGKSFPVARFIMPEFDGMGGKVLLGDGNANPTSGIQGVGDELRHFGKHINATATYDKGYYLLRDGTNYSFIWKTGDQIRIATGTPTSADAGLLLYANRMSAPPTSGTWKVGERIYNSTPTAGGYIGWVCITAGTPGAWKGFGLIQA